MDHANVTSVLNMLTSNLSDSRIDSLLDVISIYSDAFSMPLDPFVIRVLVPDVVEWQKLFSGFQLVTPSPNQRVDHAAVLLFLEKLEKPSARGPGYRVDAQASRIPGDWFSTALTVHCGRGRCNSMPVLFLKNANMCFPPLFLTRSFYGGGFQTDDSCFDLGS